MLFTEEEFQAAASVVYQSMAPTPQYAWPLLASRLGDEVWVKHENHTPIGAFKIRGGFYHLSALKEQGDINGIISATRGNHGQSLAVAGASVGIPVTIVAPEGNSVEKNAAMRAQGAELILTGTDFDEAAGQAKEIAAERGLHMVPSFHRDMCMGVSTYARELFEAVGEIDTVYVSIGLGSGICGVITQRDLLGLKTEVVGVVSDRANAYALSFEAGNVVTTNAASTFADGMAVRVPDPAALDIITKGAARVVQVSDDEVAEAVRIYYSDTHNVAEGAGAASLAARIKESAKMAGKRTAVVLTGGNIDTVWYKMVLNQETPEV
ncbi:MAG: threonine dehydratase [Hyphomicrobiales bacterium]